MKNFKTVDILEREEKFIAEAKRKFKNFLQIGHFYCEDIQNFQTIEKYDCIWIQWVYIYSY